MAGYSVRMTDAIGGVSNGAYSVEKRTIVSISLIQGWILHYFYKTQQTLLHIAKSLKMNHLSFICEQFKPELYIEGETFTRTNLGNKF